MINFIIFLLFGNILNYFALIDVKKRMHTNATVRLMLVLVAIIPYTITVWNCGTHIADYIKNDYQ